MYGIVVRRGLRGLLNYSFLAKCVLISELIVDKRCTYKIYGIDQPGLTLIIIRIIQSGTAHRKSPGVLPSASMQLLSGPPIVWAQMP